MAAEELAAAAVEGNVARLQLLLKRGSVQPEGRNAQGALVVAAEKDQAAVVRALLDYGTPLSSKDASGRKAIHLATTAGAVGVVRLLLERRVDPREPDHTDATPMSLAIKAGQMGVVKELVRAGAEVPPGADAPGLAAAIREVRIEVMTQKLRESATADPSKMDIVAADAKVWEAMREHLRLITLREEQRAGVLLVELERRILSEREAAEMNRANEAELAADASQNRVLLQKEQTILKDLIRDIEDVRSTETALFDEDTRVRAEVQEKQSELRVVNRDKDNAERARLAAEESRDELLAQGRDLDAEVAAAQRRNEALVSELQAAQEELSGWQRDKEAAAQLTAQAHKLLGN